MKWICESTDAGKPWVVAFDESGSAAHAQCPDLGYKGFDGHDLDGNKTYTQHRVRKQTLWGALMAGGAGNEYYFGYKFDQNDLLCEDYAAVIKAGITAELRSSSFIKMRSHFGKCVTLTCLLEILSTICLAFVFLSQENYIGLSS